MNISTTHEEDRTITELDHARLARIARNRQPESSGAGPIETVLDAADLVPSRGVPPDVVTMYTQVQLADLASDRKYRLTLCYPADADPAAGLVSVLSPVGASLLGLRVGAVARWRQPDGEEGAAEVQGILFQPESSGDYTL
ncbi:MAG: GreA/GreB family elongation factor [Caldimonas sp.]